MHVLTVDSSEEGMKLLAFLERRLEGRATPGELHRWIRTGQVRVNKGRARAFDRLNGGDAVRLPPFAAVHVHGKEQRPPVKTPAAGENLGMNLRVAAVGDGFLALEKPAGLPAQPGSKHDSSVVSILRDWFAAAVYAPAPAHRLDKNTSGLLLAGTAHAAQQELHALFAGEGNSGIRKTYLAWVLGDWPHQDEFLMRDAMRKEAAARNNGAAFETMKTVPEADGKTALSRASLVEKRVWRNKAVSLLRVSLETGRTHQIRVQLASRGFPIIGDAKYGGPRFSPMLLHAAGLDFLWRGEQLSLASAPPWEAPFTVADCAAKTPEK